MKRVLLVSLVAAALAGCGRDSTGPGEEGVIVDNPRFFGHGGIRKETQSQGSSWFWSTTDVVNVSITPMKIDETLDHLPTADNNFINYASYLVLQFHDNAYNLEHFGPVDGWYVHNLKEPYRTIVRDVTKQYPMTDIMTKPQTLADIERLVAERFKAHITSTGMKVTLLQVNMGKALPNPVVVAEMDQTAAQQQRAKTEHQRKLAEDGRKEAEQSRAQADNAYRQSMGLDPAQFVALEAIKRYSEACAAQGNSCVIVQGNAPILVGGK